MPSYNPADWYWQADDGRIFSSARVELVATDDTELAAWKAAGNGPTVWPRDNAGAQTTASLQAVLSPYGLFADLKVYAAAVRYNKVSGGITYQGHPIATDDASRGNIIAEAVAAQVIGAGFTTAWKCSDGTWMGPLSNTQMIAFATAVRNYVAGCFAVEEALNPSTKADVDNASWPNPALT
ncbi:DUF4376 domain-containing protein [Bradyrhizobium sp. ORS 86]|uniref:DUF4376 domain-containing protein n=1 Tax=Bradyrhizobium sp. ORS 86 TaxID=1685970 RepID=UPI00388F3C7E